MILQYPSFLDVTPCDIEITDGLSEDGSPKVISTVSKKVRVDESSGHYFDSDGIKHKARMTVYFGGNIAESTKLSGTVKIFDSTYEIKDYFRHRNPDGSVCFVELVLV